MQVIQIQKTVPCPIATIASSESSVWFQDRRFERGNFYLIHAESGTGKSSFFDFLYGKRHDYKGSILFDGNDIRSNRAGDWNRIRQQELSLVFQGFRVFSELTVLENIQLKNKLTHHLSLQKIKQLLEMLGIGDKTNIPLKNLSFGQQQRVAVIRALAQPFDFLLLDEPFSHLDTDNQQLVCRLFTDELKTNGAGLILCSLGDSYFFDYQEKLKM